jgi:lactoylglutathione lyase
MSRLQLALNVDDLDASIAFYSKLFDTPPAKTRPGYANFAVAEPPLKLVLIENPGEGGSINHLGVEVPDTDAVDATQTRLGAAGLASVDERDTTCCYARQDKFWVEGTPDGERWEIYTVLADSESFGVGDTEPVDGPGCCGRDLQEQREPAPSAVACC